MDFSTGSAIVDWVIHQVPAVVVLLLWVRSLIKQNERYRLHVETAYNLHRTLMDQVSRERTEVAVLLSEHTLTLQSIHTTIQNFLQQRRE